MKHYIEIFIPQKIESKLDKITCDCCGETIKPVNNYNVDEVEIRRKTGFDCPDGGSGVEFNPDICGKCFDQKIIPLLQSLNINTAMKEWDW